LLIIVTVISASLRISEQHGPMAKKGCVLAVVLSIFAAAMGLIPFLVSKKKKAAKLFMSLIIGAIIRVTLTVMGVVLITVIAAKEQRFWFLVFTAVFYLLFLGVETVEVVCCIKKLEFENDNESDKNGHDSCEYEPS
jgi:Na+/phosphate symporter